MSRSRIILRDHNSNVIYKRNTTNGKTYQFALVTYTSMRSAQRKIAISNVANHLANITREHEKYVSRGYRSLLLEVINGEVCLNATQVDYLTGNNDASRETYKMFIPVNPETAADNLKFLNTCARTDTVRRARRSRTVTEYEVRYIDVHGDAIDVENFDNLDAAIAKAQQARWGWGGMDGVMAVAVERVDNIISAEDRLLDKKHATVYTCGDLSALWAWGHVGSHVQVPAAV